MIEKKKKSISYWGSIASIFSFLVVAISFIWEWLGIENPNNLLFLQSIFIILGLVSWLLNISNKLSSCENDLLAERNELSKHKTSMKTQGTCQNIVDATHTFCHDSRDFLAKMLYHDTLYFSEKNFYTYLNNTCELSRHIQERNSVAIRAKNDNPVKDSNKPKK